MKKLAISFFAIVFCSNANAQVLFNRTYNNPPGYFYQAGRYIASDINGSFWVVENIYDTSSAHLLDIIHFDKNGVVLSQKDSIINFRISDISIDSFKENHIVKILTVRGIGVDTIDVLSIDENEHVIRDTRMDTLRDYAGGQLTSEGGCILFWEECAGCPSPYPHGIVDFFDSHGQNVWTIGLSHNQAAPDITETTDKDFIFYDKYNHIHKETLQGQALFQINGSYKYISPIKNGGAVLINFNGANDIVKLNSSLAKVWDIKLDTIYNAAFETSDNSLFLPLYSSFYKKYPGNLNWSWQYNLNTLTKLDSNGNEKWKQRFPFDSTMSGLITTYSETDDSAIVAVGNIVFINQFTGKSDSSKLWIVKIKNTNCLNGPCPGETMTPGTFIIYPNPVNEILNLLYNYSTDEKNISLQVFDLQGRLLLQNSIDVFSHEKTVDVSSLSSGMYFVKIGSEVKKFIKQ